MNLTPFGNIQNPCYQCGESYYDVTSGILQSDTILTGVGWIVPFPKRPGWVVSLGFGLHIDDELLLARDDFSGSGLVATRHTPYLLELTAQVGSATLVQRYWLGAANTLCAEVELEGAGNATPLLLARAWRPEGTVASVADRGAAGLQRVSFSRERDKRYETPPGAVTAHGRTPVFSTRVADLSRRLREALPSASPGKRGPSGAGGNGESSTATQQLPQGNELFVAIPLDASAASATLTLGADAEPVDPAHLPDGSSVLGVPAADRALEFETKLPRLTGAFPAEVKHGFHYDFETTQLCTLPAHGIFSGPWPTWMSSMPRVVLAEGTLDLARLGYADPATARDAVRTMLRDTPDENVPCVFASGGYNMVAADGTTCGTSPAWCIPFFNLFDLYLRAPDREWLAEIYPHLEGLIRYWLEHRTDEEGWLTYKCTWEAGEDNNPRIDPLATGDNVISDYVRPVELQAAMAHAGFVMHSFATELGRADDAARFEKLKNDYSERVSRLWDPDTGRFRDWDKTADRFIEVSGKEEYWGADFTRQSPLSLTVLLFDTATPEQKEGMKKEIEGFFRSPFTIWPSWSTFVLEAASACGMTGFAGEMAYEIASRVYHGTDRRTTNEFERPLPGAAPEYWPHDWAEFGGNDAYAWGAQTASFLIRHVLGIRPRGEPAAGHGPTASPRLGLLLSPSIPARLLSQGVRFGVENLSHRGERIAVQYEHHRGGELACTLSFEKARTLRVSTHAGEPVEFPSSNSHSFTMRNESRVEVD